MLHCKWCKTDKAVSEFYKSDIRQKGYGKCKDCVCAAVQKNRKDKLDYYQEYEKGRTHLPHRVKARYDYARTEGGKEARLRCSKSYKAKNPTIYHAHNIVNNAVRDGLLMKPENCSKCNASGNIHGHHSDYNKPLEVIWFCESCHAEWHRNNTPIYCD